MQLPISNAKDVKNENRASDERHQRSLGASVGAVLAASTAGATGGILVGPVGAVFGAVIGAVAGCLGGQAVVDLLASTPHDVGEFDTYTTRPHFRPQTTEPNDAAVATSLDEAQWTSRQRWGHFDQSNRELLEDLPPADQTASSSH